MAAAARFDAASILVMIVAAALAAVVILRISGAQDARLRAPVPASPVPPYGSPAG